MPKNIRDRMKGSIATAYLDCERALTQLAEVETTFSPTHDDLAEGLRLAGILLMQVEDLLKAFYVKAWGDLPSDWTKAKNRK